MYIEREVRKKKYKGDQRKNSVLTKEVIVKYLKEVQFKAKRSVNEYVELYMLLLVVV